MNGTLTLKGEVLSRLVLMPPHEQSTKTRKVIEREFRSLPAQRNKRTSGPPTNTDIFYEFCKALFHEHGIVAFHAQDERISAQLRDLLMFEGNMRYGRPKKADVVPIRTQRWS